MNGALKVLLPVAALVVLAGTAHGEIYTWTDARGVRHFTNSLYEVPTRYREKVKTVDLGLPEQKTDQPPGSPAPAASVPPAPAAAASPAPAAPPVTVRPAEPAARPAARPPERRSRRERGRSSDE